MGASEEEDDDVESVAEEVEVGISVVLAVLNVPSKLTPDLSSTEKHCDVSETSRPQMVKC